MQPFVMPIFERSGVFRLLPFPLVITAIGAALLWLAIVGPERRWIA